MKEELIFINIPSLMKIGFITTVTFVLAIFLTPILTHFLYKYKIRQRIRKKDVSGGRAPIFQKLHKHKEYTPTAGGILLWFVPLVVAFLFYFLAKIFPSLFLHKASFLSREQTWLPLFTLVVAGILGLFDDLINVFGKTKERGIGVYSKFFWQILIALVGSLWFFYKLEIHSIHIPAYGSVEIGFLYIPLFILVIVAATNAVNITDGLDGLAGGVLASCFTAFGALAFASGKIDLATFCAAIVGTLIAFLWFNIWPARFFMGDTGSLALGATLGVVAMLQDAIFVLPIIGFVLVAETLSSFIQIVSKKFFKKRVFKIAPLHHHFEAKGWEEPKIVMRFWLISAIFAIIGLLVGLIGRGQ